MTYAIICHLDEYVATVSSLSGRTVYINQSADRYLVSPEASPAAVRQAVRGWLERVSALRPENRPPPSLRQAVLQLGEAATTANIAQALDRVLVAEFKERLTSSSVGGMQRFLVELVLALWSVGVVAWPAREQKPFSMPSLRMNNIGFVGPQRRWLARVRAFLDRGGSDDSNNFRFILDALLSRAGVLDLGDLTPETFHLTEDAVRGKMRSTGIAAVLHCLREDYADCQITWTPEDFGFFNAKMGRLARDEEFRWLLSQEPDLEDWSKLAREHIAANPANWKKRKSAVNLFLIHLMQNPSLPKRPAAYFDIRNRPAILFDVPGNKGRQTMSVVHEFLEEVLAKTCSVIDDNELPLFLPGFAVPLARPIYKGVNKGETHRETMPTRLIRQAMAILTEDDFSWPRKTGKVSDSFRWRNPGTGEFETVWSPVRTYAIILKLLLPARTHQVRHLDSGQGDTWRYEMDNRWVANTGLNRPPRPAPVERGVFRKYRRKDGSDGTVLYFNTNKTTDVDSDTQGYVMPWEKDDALRILAAMRDWQEQFNPVVRPTAWSDIQELKATKHRDDLAKRGANFFLFRDPCHRHRPDLPVTDVRLRNLWLKLVEELERRLEQAGETLPNGGPIRLILTRDSTGGAQSAVFDLHTLRVTLITAMYEEGVPPEYLMKIVGHASVLMTLYYTKINVETLSLRMNEALLERQRKAQGEMAGFLKRASRGELEHVVAHRSPAALDAVASGTGMVVMDHGICPVAMRGCHKGLAVVDPAHGLAQHQPVPGGATNCVRCRFFLTGPAFLFGLEAHVGDLAYRLKNASHTFEKAQDRFDALSDAYAIALEAGEPFHRQRNLEIAETAFEAATAEVDGIALSLQAAYALTEQCIRINNRPSEANGVALVAVGGLEQVQAVLAECHEFEQIHRICVGATFFDGLNINWRQPNLERARLFDRMLRAAGHEARFSLLDDDDALKVANAMGQFLYARLDRNEVHALADGRTTLRAIGMEKPFLAQLETLAPRSLAASSTRLLESADP